VKKLLVANRGEIARRVFRTARAMGIATVAVFSDADEHAPHVAEADEAVRLPGVAPGDTYLDIDAVLRSAAVTGADAVHPGYGFLSENAAFARACAGAGLTFVGPSPAAIDAMGSKIAAKELMAAAGVPVLGSEGFPLLVKAAFGGGGRGMRVVRDEAELADALASAEREAAAAFGDGTVFLERFVEDPRHIEVQIFGDTHGNVVHLYERECSIQRRYQKIIEEAPSPAVDDDLRAALGSAAVAAAKALDYVGAGTVEFVLDQAGDFFFLEVNTRLQVEHPVTELVTGLDLVELQLRVARGEALPPVPPLRGHAVEARIYAEDVAAGFVPASGRIEAFDVSAGPGVRVDSGYERGSTVSTHYDAMLAKVIAAGATRAEAVGRLVEALAGARIHGVPTNRDLLVRVLRHPDFAAGHTDTGFLTRHDLTAPLAGHGTVGLHAVAAALAAQAERRGRAAVQAGIPSGWRNVATALQQVSYDVGGRTVVIGYGFGRRDLVVEVDGARLDDVRLWHADATTVELTTGGVRRRFLVDHTGEATYVDGDGSSSTLREVDRLPVPEVAVAAGSLLAPLPGSVVRVEVSPGDAVAARQVLVVLEAMKMEHSIQSPGDGIVTEVLVTVGQQVETGQVLAVVEGEGDG
jgi:propionyl-CoA carboxylase alpha chain